jgi:DNA adenine methylase
MSKKTKDPMPVRALAPWFGSGRMIAPLVGRELAGCKWIGVPFAGGMSEIAEIDARSIAVNDLHRHVVNLARVVACDIRRQHLCIRLSRLPFHPDTLATAQRNCREIENAGDDWLSVDSDPDTYAALWYFVCCWMGRSASGGCPREFEGGISTRWNANGGDSNTRYRSALRGLVEWGRIMRRCSFTCLDAFEFLDKCPDTKKTGIYVDANWPDDGEKYKHKIDENGQRRLAVKLASFHHARVVVRFGDHPLIRELYPERVTQELFLCQKCGEEFAAGEKDYRGRHPHCGGQGDPNGMVDDGGWTWLPVDGRTQTNETNREVLILNGPSRADGGMFANG